MTQTLGEQAYTLIQQKRRAVTNLNNLDFWTSVEVANHATADIKGHSAFAKISESLKALGVTMLHENQIDSTKYPTQTCLQKLGEGADSWILNVSRADAEILVKAGVQSEALSALTGIPLKKSHLIG